MPKLLHVPPKYRHHKASGRAVVTLNGSNHYLGPWKSNASKAEYDRLVGEWLTGCHPGEVCLLRPVDVDRSADVWAYRPESHKTQHHGRDRVIFIGPQAQEILRPYLLRSPTDYCFVPAESERKRRATVHAEWKTSLSCGNRPGTTWSPNAWRRSTPGTTNRALGG